MKVVREDYEKYYFQQDCASPHTANKVQKYLKSKFKDKFINKNRWPPKYFISLYICEKSKRSKIENLLRNS